MKIGLLRHPTPLIEPGICYGRLDVAVSPPAKLQMISIASDPALRDSAKVWTSPARRCRGLADTIALTLGVPLAVDRRLQELDFGAWEGQPWDAIPREDLDRWAASPCRFAPPGGESGADLIARVGRFYRDLSRDGQNCVVVSHGGPLKVLTALLLGIDVDLLVAAPPMATLRMITRNPQG
jgi:alpha-ribazole phosphatase